MMPPLPWIGGKLFCWRLTAQNLALCWDSGSGAAKEGGRWNPIGYPVVYCCADPATAILEVAVHTSFHSIDTATHVLVCAEILDVSNVHVVMPEDIPNPNWLVPGTPSNGQQEFGKSCLDSHPFIMIPSAVTALSWNLLFNPARSRGLYRELAQKVFAMDTRLNPPSISRPRGPLLSASR